MGTVGQEQQLVDSYHDPQFGHCEIYQVGAEPCFKRRRTCLSKSREEWQQKSLLFQSLKQLKKPCINTPLHFTADESKFCLQGFSSSLIQYYFPRSLRQVWHNYDCQKKKLSDSEIWYVLHTLLDCELALRSIGMQNCYSSKNVLVDLEGELKITPDFSSTEGEVDVLLGSRQARLYNEIACVVAQLCLFKELESDNFQLQKCQKGIPPSIYNFLQAMRSGRLNPEELLGAVPKQREQRLKEVASICEQVQEIEQFSESKVKLRGAGSVGGRRVRTPSASSRQRLLITQSGSNSTVKKVISPISVRRTAISKLDLLR